MKKLSLSRRPYNLFLVIAILLVVTSLIERNQQMDIHLHDTYIVFSMLHFYWACLLLIMILWGLYFILRKLKLIQFLTWLHVITTSFFFLVLMIGYLWQPNCVWPPETPPNPYYLFLEEQREIPVVVVITLVFIFGQLCLILNILYGLGVYVKNLYTNKV